VDTVRSINPHAPGDLVAEIPATPVAEFERLTDSAAKAGAAWAALTAVERGVALTKVAEDLATELDTVAHLASREVGKPIAEARAEVVRTERIFRYFAQAVLFPDGDMLPANNGDGLMFTRRAARGVVGLITPWNFPLAIPAWKLAPALAWGNAVIFKPASQAIGTAAALTEIINRHLPADVLTLVAGPGTGSLVTASRAISAVSFTGSTAVGRQVVATVSARGGVAQAEMGGQNASVVLADANLDSAVAAITGSAFAYAGQKCTATSRIIAEEAVYDEVRDALVERIAKLVVLDPADPACQVGPVIDHASRDAAALAVKASTGRVLSGGVVMDAPGSYLWPTLVEVGDTADILVTDEVFAPVAALQRASSPSHALDLANAGQYGLTAAVYTGDLAAAVDYAARLEVGMVRVNAPTTGLDYWAPFGGTKESSYGPREQGLAARDFYTESRTISLNPR
jgi:acyl-CoA reductase-like NAD-dependent aldehyde dehydrogenase